MRSHCIAQVVECVRAYVTVWSCYPLRNVPEADCAVFCGRQKDVSCRMSPQSPDGAVHVAIHQDVTCCILLPYLNDLCIPCAHKDFTLNKTTEWQTIREGQCQKVFLSLHSKYIIWWFEKEHLASNTYLNLWNTFFVPEHAQRNAMVLDLICRIFYFFGFNETMKWCVFETNISQWTHRHYPHQDCGFQLKKKNLDY